MYFSRKIDPPKSYEKICDVYQAEHLREMWKNEGQKVVFTNGCFDLLHLGHLDYLEKARFLGDKLIVGLNTDESITKLKGAARPINHQESRARMLASLQFVDMVILFGDDTPKQLIATIIPDILVKGSDYEIKDIIGASTVIENGGEVKTIDFLEGYSSTKLIEKIQANI